MRARLKAIYFATIATLSIFSTVAYVSCEQEKCKSVTCAYGGVCVQGACNCLAGYEGPRCETINRLRYLNTWNVTEDGTVTEATQYTVTIVGGPNIQEVLISNFNNRLTEPVTAFVEGDTLKIPAQTRNNVTVEGVGYLTAQKYDGRSGTMVVRYKVTDATTTNDYGLDGGDASLWNK